MCQPSYESVSDGVTSSDLLWYRIEKLYTVTATQEGDILVLESGLHMMAGKSQVPSRRAYEIALNDTKTEQVAQITAIRHAGMKAIESLSQNKQREARNTTGQKKKA